MTSIERFNALKKKIKTAESTACPVLLAEQVTRLVHGERRFTGGKTYYRMPVSGSLSARVERTSTAGAGRRTDG
ncbi:hypothetical protein ACNKHW_10225 [Shigella flexneri]